MKLHTDNTVVERGGILNESTFRIKTTAKAFDILSSGLYTDPKLAVIRELACNAYDAHVAANNSDTPFEIHLPNSLEPYLSIKDFGTGLDDDAILGRLVVLRDKEGNVLGEEREGGLYTTYFESTKTDSNDYIGALGLGSKSPFSYTKSFEVYSRFNGKKRTYCAYIDETGKPAIAAMGVCDTDEHNGLEVRIAIQPSDFWAFTEKTALALRWFPVKPIITGNPSFKWHEMPAQRLEGQGWKMFEAGFSGDYSLMTAVQGNVAYKVDVSKLELSTAERKLLETSHIVGFFNIGELEVAANREEIRYDERSMKALKTKIFAVRRGFLQSIEDQIDAMKDQPIWNVYVKLNELTKSVFGDRYIFKDLVKDSKHPAIIKFLSSNGTFQLSNRVGHEIVAYEKSSRASGLIHTRTIDNVVSPMSNIVVFYNDMASGGIARVKEWLRKQPFNRNAQPMAIVIRPIKCVNEVIMADPLNPMSPITNKTWIERDYVNELTEIRSELGDVNFLITSKDAPKPERERTVTKYTLPIYKFGGVKTNMYGKKTRIAWEKIEKIDFSKGGLWFPLENGAHICTYKDNALRRISWPLSEVDSYFDLSIRLLNRHLGTKYTKDNIVGVGSTAIAKFTKNPAWVNLFDALKQVIEHYKEAYDFQQRLNATNDSCGIKEMCLSSREVYRTHLKELLDRSVFKTHCLELMNDYEKYYSNEIPSIIHMLKKVDLDLGTKVFDNTIAKPYFTEKTFLSVYPMLSFINHIPHISSHDLPHLFRYIDLMDRS